MRRTTVTCVVFLAAASLSTPADAAPKKKPPKPAATPDPPPSEKPDEKTEKAEKAEKPEKTEKPAKSEKSGKSGPIGGVRAYVCPDGTSIDVLEPKTFLTFLSKKCHPIGRKKEATTIDGDERIVVVCVPGGGSDGSDGDEKPTDVDEIASCGVKGTIARGEDDAEGNASARLSGDGDLALSIKAPRLAKALTPSNGVVLTLTLTKGDAQDRLTLVYRTSVEGYGHGLYVWLPLPMLTTDFTFSGQNTSGYRLGVSPFALAVGAKFFPSPTSSAYVGLSAFGAWNLVVPNDTQTLSNGTQVRINYKAAGGGLLFDASGWVGIGVGVGHTFTSDARTDFRGWLYFGPRLLEALTDF